MLTHGVAVNKRFKRSDKVDETLAFGHQGNEERIMGVKMRLDR